MLVRITQQDVVYRRYLQPNHRSFVPDFGVYIKVPGANGGEEYRSISRQMVLFCVERRKSWRMLQSKAGIDNKEYKSQRSILADVDAGKISKEDFFVRAEELMKERLSVLAPAPAPARAPAPAATPAPQNAQVLKPTRTATPQPTVQPRTWKQPGISEGADDVIDWGICPLCEETLRLAYPEAVDLGGQIVHAKCAAKAVEQPQGD